MAKRKPLELAVKFGNVSVGTETVTISASLDRGEVDYVALAEEVVGARLEVKLAIDKQAANDADGQQKLIATELELESIADCPSLQIKPQALGFRLAFSAADIDIAQIAHAAQQSGTVTLRRIGDARTDKPASGGIDPGPED